MTNKMAAPVQLVCRHTDSICRDYAYLSDNEMAALQTDIMHSTDEITELLDQVIKEPAGL